MVNPQTNVMYTLPNNGRGWKDDELREAIDKATEMAACEAKDATITVLREGLAKALSFVPDIDNCHSDPSPGELAELSALLSSTLPRETEELADPEAGKRDAVAGAASVEWLKGRIAASGLTPDEWVRRYNEYVPSTASVRDALLQAQAALWDSYYGKGISISYAHEVDKQIRAALAAHPSSTEPPSKVVDQSQK